MKRWRRCGLDTGTPTSLITGGLRRAVITRDRHCAFPGCDTPPNACQIHHLIAVHQWGWTLTLHPDGTTTAISPDRTRTLHSHGPSQQAA